MKKNFKLGIIGAGFMASAIIKGILDSKVLSNLDIICSAKTDESLNKISKINIKTTKSNIDIVRNADFVLFAVKPQNLIDVFNEIKNENLDKVISILAGVKKEKFKKYFNNVRVARCMPNTPCSINAGAIGLDVLDFDKSEDIDFIKNIFTPLGKVVLVKEDLLNAVTGISGSSPAYFYLFTKYLIESGVNNGLSFDDSFDLVVNTMFGSSLMLKENKDKIDLLIDSVCCKGGTTIEAIKTFDDNNLRKIVNDAVKNCIKRATELEKQ